MKENNETTAKPADKKPAEKVADAGVHYKCVVLKQSDGGTVTIGNMICGAGAKATLSESKAKAAEKQGWVKLLGIA